MSDDKQWSDAEIRHKLATNDKWLVRGIVAIYQKQTASERRAKSTHKRNGVGFNSVDAGFLSDLAQSAIDWKEQHGELSLTDAQIRAAREQMLKYAGQLADIANGEI